MAGLLTKGTAIEQLCHFGRRPNALQRTGLEWYQGLQCSIDGCTSTARLEVDHVADWAHTKVTDLRHLTLACGPHHDLKTHKGFRFSEPMANGKRRLIPPDGDDPSDGTDPPPDGSDPPGATDATPMATSHPHRRDGTRRRSARREPVHALPPGDPDRPELF